MDRANWEENLQSARRFIVEREQVTAAFLSSVMSWPALFLPMTLLAAGDFPQRGRSGWRCNLWRDWLRLSIQQFFPPNDSICFVLRLGCIQRVERLTIQLPLTISCRVDECTRIKLNGRPSVCGNGWLHGGYMAKKRHQEKSSALLIR